MEVKKVKAPVRIDFGGGTTDIEPFTYIYGGAVLNATIDKFVTGKIIRTSKETHLEYTGEVPTSSGLGTSGVMNLVWLALISKTKNKKELADRVYDMEQAMGLVGGKQDQYAAAFGGINFMKFKKSKVEINRLKLPTRFVRELEKRLVLVYMGKPHFSGHSNKLAIQNLIKGRNKKNLIRIKEIAYEMKKSLEQKKMYKFAELMNQETRERDRLHEITIGKSSEDFINKGLKNGAIAAKICGSGAGGSVLFFAEDKDKLIKTFKEKVIDFKFEFRGLRYL
ncbi:hypothetical protein GF386_05355 [Candidatus Pacearchaeota archaeon]|nr:hypothetical protein [Candidatus Pacearchaeota archaeon]MBD3283515.1 hypothetical protein [Candidatus Pacearchaeota archaeon]